MGYQRERERDQPFKLGLVAGYSLAAGKLDHLASSLITFDEMTSDPRNSSWIVIGLGVGYVHRKFDGSSGVFGF